MDTDMVWGFFVARQRMEKWKEMPSGPLLVQVQDFFKSRHSGCFHKNKRRSEHLKWLFPALYFYLKSITVPTSLQVVIIIWSINRALVGTCFLFQSFHSSSCFLYSACFLWKSSSHSVSNSKTSAKISSSYSCSSDARSTFSLEWGWTKKKQITLMMSSQKENVHTSSNNHLLRVNQHCKKHVCTIYFIG